MVHPDLIQVNTEGQGHRSKVKVHSHRWENSQEEEHFLLRMHITRQEKARSAKKDLNLQL